MALMLPAELGPSSSAAAPLAPACRGLLFMTASLSRRSKISKFPPIPDKHAISAAGIDSAGFPPHQDLGPPVPAAALFAGRSYSADSRARKVPTANRREA
jgi:hypothetical protein